MKQCPKCGSKDLDIGHVIHPVKDTDRHIASFQDTINHQNMRVIYCIKCINCGHSEFLSQYDSTEGGGEKVHINLRK